jgi:diguanylate cyclase (GGDEF)-like protein
MGRLTIQIKFKLILLFIVTSLIPILIVSYINYNKIKENLTHSVISNLEAIAKLKSNEIERFFERKIIDINIFATSPYTLELFKESKNQKSKKFLTSKAVINQQIVKFIHKRDIHEVFIFSKNKELITEVTKHSDGNNSIKYFDEAFEKGKMGLYFSPLYTAHEDSSTLLAISMPIFDSKKQLLGVVIAEVIFNKLFTQVQDYTGLGETGETILGKRDKGYIYFLNTLRHDPNSSMHRKIKVGERDDCPIDKSTQGENGSGLYLDYREKEIVGAWRNIKIVNWGLVVKMDADEAFLTLQTAKNSIFISSVLLLLFLIALVLFAIENIITPVKHTEKQAFLDTLTSLPNRRQLEYSLEKTIETAEKKELFLSVLFLDLDGFKAVNDTYGHEIGDKLLIEVSKRVCSTVRETDIVSRLGGDEFVVVLKETYKEDSVAKVAQNIIDVINEPFYFNNNQVFVGTSIGISLYPKDGKTQDELLKKADSAMYSAKNDGKNRYKFVV